MTPRCASSPPFPEYDIFAPDLINIYIPPEAVFSDQLIIASTQIRIEATRGTLLMTAGRCSQIGARQRCRPRGSTLTLELRLRATRGWPFLGQPQSYLQTRRSSKGFAAEQTRIGPPKTTGGTPRCSRAREEMHLSRLHRRQSRGRGAPHHHIDGYEEYDITYPETIELVAPKSAVLSDQVTAAANTSWCDRRPARRTSPVL